MDLANRLYRWLLRLYPRDLRTRFGADMQADFAELLEATRSTHGRHTGTWIAWRRVLVDAMRSVPSEHLMARRAARLRRTTGWGPMGWGWVQDVAYAVRGLRRAPGFSFVAVATLSIGIGVNTAMFTLVEAVVLAPLPFDEDGRLVRVWRSGNIDKQALRTFQTQANAFETVVGYGIESLRLVGTERPDEILAAAVSPGHFSLMGGEPMLGRTFVPDELDPAAPATVVLSHAAWQGRFGGDAAILGTSVRLVSGAVGERTVVGVMPPDYRDVGYDPVEVWIPLADPAPGDDLSAQDLFVTARLAPGVDVGTANTEVRRLAEGIRQRAPRLNGEVSVERADVVPLMDYFVPERVRLPILILFGCVGLVLLIACGNVANLLLVRGQARTQELGVRAALGASRVRVFRLLLIESAVLGALGGVVGIFAASLAHASMVSRLGALDTPRLDEVTMGPSAFVFAGLMAVGAAVLMGIVPAVRASSPSRMQELRSQARGTSIGRAGIGMNNALVAAQVALALVVAIGGGLMLRTVDALSGVEPGFATHDRLVMRLLPPADRYADLDGLRAYYDDALSGVRATPGVLDAQLTACPPRPGVPAGPATSRKVRVRRLCPIAWASRAPSRPATSTHKGSRCGPGVHSKMLTRPDHRSS